MRIRTGRRSLAALLGAVVLTVAACSANAPTPPAELPGPDVPAASPAGHPNIVFVLTDDLDTGLLRYMPHVQALAARGASFTDYDVADTLCCPSRSSIFTGMFPHDTGVFTNTGTDGGFDVFHARGEENDTFATDLQRAGYRTAMMGKYLNGYEPTSPDGTQQAKGSGPGYVPPGWNEWDVAGNGYPEYDYTLNHNGVAEQHGHDPSDYLTDVLSGRAQDFVRTQAAANRPFLLEVATFAPHGPSTPAPRDANAFPGLQAPRDPSFDQPNGPTAPSWLRDRPPLAPKAVQTLDRDARKRAQSVQAVDAMIGNLESTLDQTGQAGNTEIVFSSDNGFHLGQHRLAAGKQTAFATDLTVPLVVAGPGVAHGTAPQTAQNVDLAPTFADLAHAAPLPHADGRSLVPLLTGQHPPDWRTTALVEHHGPNLDATDPDRPKGPRRNRANPPTYTAIKVGPETYVEYADGEREYYDTRTDPYQRDNTVGRLPPDRIAALHATLTALAGCHGATACWRFVGGSQDEPHSRPVIRR